MNAMIARAAPLAAVLALAASAAHAAEAGKSPSQCFWTRDVNGFNAVDDKTVMVRVGVRDVYQFDMLGPCSDINWSEQIAIISRGGSRICSSLDAEIVTPSTIGPHRCAVKMVRKLTPAEVAALPAKHKP